MELKQAGPAEGRARNYVLIVPFMELKHVVLQEAPARVQS